MPNEERIDLVVGAETKGAQDNLKQMSGALSDSEKAVQAMRQQFTDMAVALDAAKIKIAGVKNVLDQQETATARATAVAQQYTGAARQQAQAQQQSTQASAGAAQGLGGLLGVAKQFYGAASMGAQGAQGLANVLGAINPIAGVAAHALLGVGNALKGLVQQAIPTLAQMQGVAINLQSLAAQELVKAGQFENAEQAMDSAALAATGLLRELRLIDLESPFDDTQVMQTFRSGMAYGFTADQALKLTRASLNMAAGLGKSGSEMEMIGMVMGQMRSVGKLLTQDLRQLQSRGVNVADMLKNQLGVSIEQFNAVLAIGKYTMDDLLEVFDKFASTNFAGAGERMAKTFEGIKSSLSSLKNVAYTTLLQPSFDKFTTVMAEGLEIIQDFVFNSGLLEKVGERISAFTSKIADFASKGVAFARGLVNILLGGNLADELDNIPEKLRGPLEMVQRIIAGLTPALRDAAQWVKMIWLNWWSVGEAIWKIVKPAFDWFVDSLSWINLDTFFTHLRDNFNSTGQIVYNLIEVIRRILSGNAESALAPLHQAFVYTLTMLALIWDRWAANAITWGWNLVVQIANGIINAARSVLATAMNYVGSFIGLFLKPGSPPKQGPLSHIAEWGKGLIETYARSFKTADFGLLKSSLAPLQQALQSALQAGTLSETEYPQVFAAVRTDVAALIAEFRKTGEISETVLSNIAGRLGEGGEELTKFLRLQLAFQKAQTNLEAVEKDVAAARAKGFVSREMADRLKAAQEQAGAAKDELDWQKEYLGLQQDSVDLQLQLVKALEKLANVLDKVGKATADGVDKAAGGAGAGALATPTPFTSNLMDFAGGGAGGLGELAEDAEALSTAMGGISKQFSDAQKKVETWLALPLAEKLQQLKKEIAKSLGLSAELQFLETFMGLPLETKISYVKNKIEQLTGIDFDTLFDNLKAGVVGLAGRVYTALLTEIPKLIGRVGLFLSTLLNNVLTWLSTNAPTWGEKIGTGLGSLFGAAMTFWFETLPQAIYDISVWFVELIEGIAEWIIADAIPLAREWLRALNAVLTAWFMQITAKTPDWIKSLLETGEELIFGFVAGFVENAPEWAVDLLKAGVTFVDTIWQGVVDEWNLLTRFGEQVRTTVRQVLLNIGTWITNLKEAGVKMVGRIKAGIDDAWDFLTYLGGKFTVLVQALRDGASATFDGVKTLGATIVQKIKDGLTEVWDMATWMSTMLTQWWADLTTGASNGWLTGGVAGAGRAIIENLKAGIRATWSGFVEWWRRLLDDLTKPLPSSEPRDHSSPLYGLGKRGAALVENLRAGIDINPLNAHLRAQLEGTRRILSDAGLALNMQQSYSFGNVVFPNVRDGRDAAGIEQTLSRLTLAGRMTARVGGT